MESIINSEAIYSCIAGKRNQRNNQDCEDVVFVDQSTSIHFFGLADGQTGKRYCREGGIECLKEVFKYVAKKGILKMLQYEHIDELQYEIVRLIRNRISDLARIKNADKSEFASTLLVFSYDTHNGNYVLIHLGDGCIICDRIRREPTMISTPENGFSSNYTWLTTSHELLSHMKISFGNIMDFKRIVMTTDGASTIAKGKNLLDKAKSIIHLGSQTDVIQYIKCGELEDDAGCVIVDFIK